MLNAAKDKLVRFSINSLWIWLENLKYAVIQFAQKYAILYINGPGPSVWLVVRTGLE